MATRKITLSIEAIEEKIFSIRGQRVMLDTDLAALYGVRTNAFNQAVKRNLERFPEDFMFRLNGEEFQELGRLRSQIVTSNRSRGGRRTLPYAFTEQGVSVASPVPREFLPPKAK